MKLFLFVHLIGFALGFGAVLLVDIVGALWVFKRVGAGQLMWLSGIAQRIIWSAVVLLLVSGAYLIDPAKLTWQTELKLAAVAMLIINGFVLDRIRTAVIDSKTEDFWRLARKLQLQSVVSISVSQLGWWTAVIIGFLNSMSHR